MKNDPRKYTEEGGAGEGRASSVIHGSRANATRRMTGAAMSGADPSRIIPRLILLTGQAK